MSLALPNEEDRIDTVTAMLRAHGFALDGPHGKDTPRRFSRWLWAQLNDKRDFKFTMFGRGAESVIPVDQMIVLGPIRFYSVCAHHLLPFFGTAHVAYLPSPKGFPGLSKIARVVKAAASGAQVQEHMTHKIANTIFNAIKPNFVMVVTKARHLCMEMRGVESPEVTTTHSAILPVSCKTDETKKNEALRLMGF